MYPRGSSARKMAGCSRLRVYASASPFRSAGPSTPKPDYTSIDTAPFSQLAIKLFRRKLAAAVGEDSTLDGYDGVIDLTRKLHAKYKSPRETQTATRLVLR